MKPQVQFRVRIYRDEHIAIGPGKIELLEAIDGCGSISAAAKQLGMSYRRAWLLVDEMNRSLASAAVETALGGTRGGGAVLTETGREVVRRYRGIEAASRRASARHIAALVRLLAR